MPKPVQNTIKLFVSKSCQISRGLALMNINLNIELKNTVDNKAKSKIGYMYLTWNMWHI